MVFLNSMVTNLIRNEAVVEVAIVKKLGGQIKHGLELYVLFYHSFQLY